MVTTKRPKKGPNPAELPAPELGTGGSGGRVPTRPGGIGGPAELPAALRASALVNEVITLRQRLHTLENQFLALSIGRRFGGTNPAELPAEFPEGGEGGGGGIVFPGEIAEFNPAELPVDFNARAVRDIATLTSRVAALEANVLKSIAALSKSINQMKFK